MYQFEREEKIMQKLFTFGQIKVREESKYLGISLPTLHRDLIKLEKQGLIERVRGGAILSKSSKLRTRFDIRMKTNVEEKKEIALKAAKTIEDETSIFLDHSSTIVFLALELKLRHFRNLIILTNSLVIPNELAGKDGVQIILTGGVVESEYKALSGRWVIESLKNLHLNKIFVSVGAISLEHGLMSQTHFICELMREILNFPPPINILADSSKFLKTGAFHIAPLTPSLQIFTDKGISRTLQNEIRQRGLELII